MPLPRPASPRALVQDIRAIAREKGGHRLFAAVAAVIIPAAIIYVFYLDPQTNIAPGPQIVYVESWPADRTDAEIQAKQKADLEQRQAAEAERRRQFQRLDNRLEQLGI